MNSHNLAIRFLRSAVFLVLLATTAAAILERDVEFLVNRDFSDSLERVVRAGAWLGVVYCAVLFALERQQARHAVLLILSIALLTALKV
ncbi:hypothetical protein [Bradyrhizobium sp. LHD-71]|uniref:hypothetical protein n=1 Tax=Bradyrhizobium sp. LHD-71 TaxID=3072141 RepID=UPI00280E5ED1|nr:hypothetical protein [Bradyrhizobium sp. LHD-71]MDQ8728341.1 hypothetical protein [Bradyrhizobium sp. LHD-71]